VTRLPIPLPAALAGEAPATVSPQDYNKWTARYVDALSWVGISPNGWPLDSHYHPVTPERIQ